MKSIRDVFCSLEEYRGCQMVTVLEGENAGEKGIRSEKEILFAEGEGISCIWDQIPQYYEGVLLTDHGKVFCEKIGRMKRLVICGGGHVAIAVIRIAKMLEFHITVVEDRLSFADDARRAGADQVLCDDFFNALKKISGDLDTCFLIVTRGHRYDEQCLEVITEKPFGYLGMMGSRRRTAMVRDHMKEQGVSEKIIQKLHAPVGLSIGAETPEEIAVSIMAEIIQCMHSSVVGSPFPEEIVEALKREADQPAVLATIMGRKGSAPRSVGTKMLILKNHHCAGTIGGGCAEAEVLQEGLALLRREERISVCQISMTAREAEEEGMVCGGVITVLLEKLTDERDRI